MAWFSQASLTRPIMFSAFLLTSKVESVNKDYLSYKVEIIIRCRYCFIFYI